MSGFAVARWGAARTAVAVACLLGVLAAVAGPAAAVDAGAPPAGPTASPAPPDPAEAEREAREREEEERAAREQAERERAVGLATLLEEARTELADGEAGLVSALANANRATGDLVVARLDLADAKARTAQARREERGAVRQQRIAARMLKTARDTLAKEAAAAYKAGSTSQTAPMIAIEALTRSRSPQEFAAGVGYLNAVLGNRATRAAEADRALERAVAAEQAAARDRQRAEEATAAAEAALAAAEADAPRQQVRLERLLDRHVARARGLSAHAVAQRTAALEADVGELTARSVELAGDLATVAGESADFAVDLRAGFERIAAGRDGPTPWRDFRCPLDGQAQFVNDWGFPRSGGRSHEGTDVFAERGTPIVAMAGGTVVDVSRADIGLGGLTLTYEVDGHRIYNAHLERVAEGLETGDRLAAGDVIGTVGTSGNALGTPPHNHIGIYRTADDAPLNPYPILRRACR